MFQLVKQNPNQDSREIIIETAPSSPKIIEKNMKRKHSETDNNNEIVNTLTLVNGISIPIDKTNKKEKKKKIMTEEKILKLEKEKVILND